MTASEGAAVALTYTHAVEKAKEVVATIEKAGGRGLAIAADSRDVAAVVHTVAGRAAGTVLKGDPKTGENPTVPG